MKQFSFKDSMVLKIKSSGMTEQQKRIIKSINTQIIELISTEEEDRFFESTEEVVRLIAALTKQSHFANFIKLNDEVAYAEQALEASFDSVQEKLYTDATEIYDS